MILIQYFEKFYFDNSSIEIRLSYNAFFIVILKKFVGRSIQILILSQNCRVFQFITILKMYVIFSVF